MEPWLPQQSIHSVYRLLEVVSVVKEHKHGIRVTKISIRKKVNIVTIVLLIKRTSPNMRMSVTDIRIAAQGGTSLSKNMGRDCEIKTK